MPELDDHRSLLDCIYGEWNRAEGDIKQAEQVCAEVVNPAINELRYAGRRLIDAIGSAYAGKDHAHVKALLTDALFDCHRARHDAVDAATSKIAIDLVIYPDKLGIDVVLQAFPHFSDLVGEVDALREKIVASRTIRENRENIYTGIETVDFPSLVASYNRFKASEPIMRELAERNRKAKARDRLLGIGGVLIGVISLAVTVASWLFPRSP